MNSDPLASPFVPAGGTPAQPRYAIDPVTLMINECMVISLAMRKQSRWAQTGVAAIFALGDFFADDDILLALSSPSASAPRANGPGPVPANPLHLSFLQLRAILADTADINAVDSLTLLQPFLLTIESGSTSGNITALALNAIAKLLQYNIISFRSKNLANMLVQLTSSLTHCRFEASDQNTDDAVLLRVLRLLESIVVSPLSTLLPNAVVSEVIHTCVSLACNKRRSEVLRRAAEMAMVSMTVKIFLRVRELEPAASTADVLPQTFSEFPSSGIEIQAAKKLDSDAAPLSDHVSPASATVDLTPVSPRKLSTVQQSNEQYDIQCINEYFTLLISMCSPSNQYQHMESTRVLALSLINTAVEVAGDQMPRHPSLMALLADPVSKDVLQIISSTESPALLQAALRLFCTMAVILSDHLKSQIELTFNLLFKSILPEKSSIDKNIKGTTAISSRAPSSKEMIVEAISYLWTRSPQFFSRLFVEFDCDFEKSDLATTFIEFLCELSLPESALVTTDNVPPICLEGVLSFVSGVNERAKSAPKSNTSDPQMQSLIENKVQKNSFIRCTEIFNENAKKGVTALYDEGFISDVNNPKELASFFFKKSTRLNKKVLGEYLAKPTNISVLKEFMALFDFGGLRVDEGLRMMLKSFRLPGESQQIERIVELFADVFVSSQTAENNAPLDDQEREPVLPDRDAVFILSYSIIMLNTDLHNPQVKKLMDLEAYRRNLKGVYNGKDFPEWYMKSIYDSIRDREIIMPEEHHGTDKWFDDVWHNLISSQSKWARDHENNLSDIDNLILCEFDKLLFQAVAHNVIDTLIKVFKEASDDNIITKLMSSIDKCANICITYHLEESVNFLIVSLSELTTLTGVKPIRNAADDLSRPDIPITQIAIEKREDPITVSELSVHFGRDFKAQLSTVVLFRLVKKPKCSVSKSWDSVLKIILTLFENCLIDPNLLSEFQKKLKLPSLAKVKPSFIIQKVKPLKDSGLLSTFSSFLKGYSDEPPEPSDQEIEATLSAIDCVRSVNIRSVFDVIFKGDVNGMKAFVSIITDNIPLFSEEKKRFYEAEVVFLFELMVCLSLIIDDENVYQSTSAKLREFLQSKHVTKKGFIRLCTYYMLVARNSKTSHKETIEMIAEQILGLDKEVLAQHGSCLVQPLLSLIDDDSGLKELISEQSFWNLLRLLSSLNNFAENIYSFAVSIVHQSPEDITAKNFVSFLGLLDEISSAGAVGAQCEQTGEVEGESVSAFTEEERLVAQKKIELSKKCISLTGELSAAQKGQSYPLIQALAHQCFNPCREVRAHAVRVLQITILSGKTDENYTAEGIFEYGLFPLLTELEKDETLSTDPDGFGETQVQVLSMVSKTFLQFHGELSKESLESIWTKIVDNFVVVNGLGNDLKEPSLEVMKNMILVLQNDFLQAENGDIWKSTWAKLDGLFPGLQEEVAAK